MAELLVTDKMLKRAKAFKGIGTLTMSPQDFLKLTTNMSMDAFIEKEGSDRVVTPRTVAPLETYNDAARKNDIDDMPFLEVDKDTGAVHSHEGRFRSIAVIQAGGTKMRVAIYLRHGGRLECFEEPYGDDLNHPRRFWKRYFGLPDVPHRFIGQFNHAHVVPDRKTWFGFYTDRETREEAMPKKGSK